MSKIYKNISVENNIYFCTGLAAESSVFRSATKEISQGDVVTLYYARNGYGGTGQLISEILSKEKYIDPKSLIVLGKNEKGEETTLIDNFINDLWKSEGRKAVLFLETPTNPELQMHDFDKLIKSLHKYKEDFNITIPVIVDTTMAPLYQLFDQEYSNDWPFIIVKSGSKYYTKGKATLGVAFCGEDKIAQNILKKAKEYGNYTDSFAKSYQLKKLSEGLTDLEIRMKKITSNTKEIADNLKIKIKSKKLNFICYTMTEEQIKAGLYSGIISFYLPPAPTKELDLVDEFVNYLLKELPNLVRNRVSYGQSSNNSETDFVYVINPQESTQGSLSKEVKEAQKRNNVQICRISVPANCEVNKINQVINQFIDSKYS